MKTPASEFPQPEKMGQTPEQHWMMYETEVLEYLECSECEICGHVDSIYDGQQEGEGDSGQKHYSSFMSVNK